MTILPRPKFIDEGNRRWKPSARLSAALGAGLADTEPSGLLEFSAEKIPPGAYRLSAGATGVGIGASDREGRRNALATLRQILRQADPTGMIPELLIRDEPAFRTRGMMLDVSRCRVPTMATLKRLVDLWAEIKINQIQLYTEHTFAYAGHQTVWRDSSPLTAEEIEELERFCRERCIELVPNQNSFGHMERWLKHPEYHRYAEAPGGFTDDQGVFRNHASTLDLEKPETIEFLRGLYDELLPHFSSRIFNIGGDETYDLGKGSNAALCGNLRVERVYLKHLKRIIAEVERRGYVPQIYADIILKYPQLLPEVPEGAVLMNWGYEPDHPFEKETALLAESGREFQVCSGTSSWNSLAGRWTAARENVRNAAKWGLSSGASGFIVTDWGDNGHLQQYAASLPGWLAGAAAAWNGESGADEDVAAALQIHLFENPGGGEAGWLLRLGELYRENPVQLHNMSFLALPLLDYKYPYYRGHYAKLRRGGMGRAAEIAREAAAALGGSGGNWRSQLSFTARFASFAADLADPFYKSEDCRIEGIPAELRSSLAGRLGELMEDYAAVWRNYCRPGGLDESLETLAGVHERL